MAAPITSDLNRIDSIFVTLLTTTGFISMTCVFVMFLFMFRNIYRERRANPLKWRLIKEPIDIYILLLFIGGLIQGLGYVLNIRWLYTGIVVEGAYCTAQGGISQFGETGLAMTTLVIAIHSFVTVWWRKGVHNLLVASAIMAIVWSFVFSFVVGGITANAHKDYITPTPLWCWIGPRYPLERILGERIWFWLTLLFSILTYIPLYFFSRGNIIVSDKVWWKFSFRQVQSSAAGRQHVLGLLAYPIVYLVLVLPLSIVHWITVMEPSSIMATVVFGLNGAFDVLLLLTIRQDVLLFNKPPSSTGNTDRSTSYGMAPLAIQATGHERGRLPDSSMHEQTCPHCRMSFLSNDPPPPPAPVTGRNPGL